MAKVQTGHQKASTSSEPSPGGIKAKKVSRSSLTGEIVQKREIGFAGPKVTLTDGTKIIPSVDPESFVIEGITVTPVRTRFGMGRVERTFPRDVAKKPKSKAESSERSVVVALPGQPAAQPISEDPMHIAETIRQFAIGKHPSWKSLLEDIPGAKIFAIECSPTSVDLRKDGKFSTRARLLVEVPKTLSTGRKSFGSVTVPAFVSGTLQNDGKLKIKEFRLSARPVN